MGMLATAINNLHRLDAILPTVRRLGDQHRDYGVSAEHYAMVGAALLWTLEQGLGAGFTSEVKAAWSEAYCALAGAMQQGEPGLVTRSRRQDRLGRATRQSWTPWEPTRATSQAAWPPRGTAVKTTPVIL